MGEEEAQAEAWSVLAGGNSVAQRLRDDFARAAELPEPEPEPKGPAGAALVVLAPRDVGAAVERKPDEIDWPLVTRSLSSELCTAPDATGSLMLHRLAAKRAPLQTVQAALDAFPEALHERTAAGNLAYDLAVAAGAEPAVVDKLFVGHLQAIGELDELKSVLRDEGGERGLSRQAQEVLASAAKSRARLCAIDSNAAKKLGLSIVDRRLLGELISGSQNLRRVQEKQAMAAAPRAASAELSGLELPLELALKHQAPGVVISRLMEEQPTAHGTTVEGVLRTRSLPSLASLWRPAFRFTSRRWCALPSVRAGHLPLHWAVKHQAPSEVVQTLLASQPGSAAVKTKGYHYPAGKAAAYRDRAEHGVRGQHIGGWPAVEHRRSLQEGEHLGSFAVWPGVNEDASDTVASTDDAGKTPAGPVRLTVADGPLGVRWTIPTSSEIPFR